MLPIDHLPLTAPNLEALGGAFAAMGFTLSPRGGYTSPDAPEARWISVFLRQGWFDLQVNPQAEPGALAVPGGCLFLAADLEAAKARLEGFRTRPEFRLERFWDDDLGLPREDFAYFEIRERISPLILAVISHHYPCHDMLPAWMEHANSAEQVAGVVFGGEERGPFAGAAAGALDLSGFEYWEASRFEAAFGPMDKRITLRVRVASLAKAKAAVETAALHFHETDEGLHVIPPRPLGCGFQFFEA